MKQKDILIIGTSIFGVLITGFLVFYSLSFLGMAISNSVSIQESAKFSVIQFDFSGYKALNL